MAKEVVDFQVWWKYESADETGTEDAETDGGNNKSVRRIHI